MSIPEWEPHMRGSGPHKCPYCGSVGTADGMADHVLAEHAYQLREAAFDYIAVVMVAQMYTAVEAAVVGVLPVNDQSARLVAGMVMARGFQGATVEPIRETRSLRIDLFGGVG